MSYDSLKVSFSSSMRILSNSKLQLLNEDQLLTFVNSLYSENSMYSILYEYICFQNVQQDQISIFLEIFDINVIQSFDKKDIED